MKGTKAFSISLGFISIAFGLLKFISPFKDWYAEQIKTSGLPQFMYAPGIIGEIVTGISFLFPFTGYLNEKQSRILLMFANISLIILMIAATAIHLIPDVPARVLPLKIKPPIIPLMFLVATIFNLMNTVNTMKK